jgi:hypothetical protein
MSPVRIQNLTNEQLVEQFVEIALDQESALFKRETSKFNRLFDRKIDIVNELKSRAGDQRRLLLNLFNHANIQVRLNAAKATLAVAPQTARTQLQVIRDSKEYPQAFDAGMAIRGLDDGTYRPT